MHPAFSVIFLTTLIGAGQGLFLALFSGQTYSAVHLLPAQHSSFYIIGSLLAVALLLGGLAASFFHLGHPERAWRAASQWRTSWLSREVIERMQVLPIEREIPVEQAALSYQQVSHVIDSGRSFRLMECVCKRRLMAV